MENKLMLLDDIKKQIQNAVSQKYQESADLDSTLSMREIFSVIDGCIAVWPIMIAPNGVRNAEIFTVRPDQENEVIRDENGKISHDDMDNEEFWKLEEDSRIFGGLIKDNSEKDVIKRASKQWSVPEEMIQVITCATRLGYR